MERCVQTALGRYRTFFGHPQDGATHRKAVAFDPQSTVGDMLNLGLWLVWHELDRSGVRAKVSWSFCSKFMITLYFNCLTIQMIH